MDVELVLLKKDICRETCSLRQDARAFRVARSQLENEKRYATYRVLIDSVLVLWKAWVPLKKEMKISCRWNLSPNNQRLEDANSG